ncbi:MAG: hypothetical protein D6707_12015 [Bacteroidetes bacterium]|nr:MAG: hypothetical protein D6707_12015 [Bacteroidota bacterium]
MKTPSVSKVFRRKLRVNKKISQYISAGKSNKKNRKSLSSVGMVLEKSGSHTKYSNRKVFYLIVTLITLQFSQKRLLCIK